MTYRFKHSPLLDVGRVCELYSEKDGVPISYVLTTEKPDFSNQPIDIFYRDTPHPEFGNNYFGLYFDRFNRLVITSSDWVEGLRIGTIKDSKDFYHYSRYRHDLVSCDMGFIDGGRAYDIHSGNAQYFKVTKGQLEKD